jgi:hypothetical protein
MLIRHRRHRSQSDIYTWRGRAPAKIALSTDVYGPSTKRASLAQTAVAFFLRKSAGVRWRL